MLHTIAKIILQGYNSQPLSHRSHQSLAMLYCRYVFNNTVQ